MALFVVAATVAVLGAVGALFVDRSCAERLERLRPLPLPASHRRQVEHPSSSA